MAMALPNSAQADSLRHRYSQTWREVAEKKVGPYDGFAGRNYVRSGVLTKHGPRRARPQELRDGIAVMSRMLNPAPSPAPAPVETVAVAPAPAAPPASGGYAIPSYIVECESGGSYTASNPSGAYGAYQIMPGTASAYGCDLSTPTGQDACAAEIYAAEGASPWACG